MSETRDIQIQGDGNVIGDNNRILVDKRIYAKITHQSNGRNGGGKNGNEEDGSWIFVMPFAFLIAVAIATWKFALYAHVLYMTLFLVALLLVGLQVLTLVIGISRNVPTTWIVERTVAIAGIALLGVAVYWSRLAYPNEVSELAAKAVGWSTFMCGLSSYGHQVSMLHMLSMCFVALPCAAFLAVNSFGALAASAFFTFGWRWSGKLAIQLGVRWVLVVGSLFAIAAFASQTSAVFTFWQETVLTRDHDPFLSDGKGFSFCRQIR
jgi:hypothetical protein